MIESAPAPHKIIDEPAAMDANSSKYKIEEFEKKYKRLRATRKIGRFLRKTDPRVRSKFLQSVCSDAGVCIAFGKHSAAIRKHFDNFNNFNLLSKDAKQIGSASANGFVKELTYENRGYVANAVLKSSNNNFADNLLYEAMVGFFLNKMSMFYPSFVETYGLYEYNMVEYAMMKIMKSVSPHRLINGLKMVANDQKSIDNALVKKSCSSPTSMAVLIQHLKSAETIENMCKTETFVKNDLVYVLYQIYMTLSSLSDVFTHYDLHDENVLVYEPVKGSHIEYHYHDAKGNKETVFRSKYIAKIIDYGRCFYHDKDSTAMTGDVNSFYKNIVCKECKPRCGENKGYQWLNNKPNLLNIFYFISSQVSNPSHDLRLLHNIGDNLPGMDPKLKTYIGRVVYGEGLNLKDKKYGTKPNRKSGYPKKINHVGDAFTFLGELVNSLESETENERHYRGSNKLGELHIYMDKKTPMRFVSA